MYVIMYYLRTVVPNLYSAVVGGYGVELSMADKLLSFKMAVVSILGFPQAKRTSRQMKVASTTPVMILSRQWFFKWPAEYVMKMTTGLTVHYRVCSLTNISPFCRVKFARALGLSALRFSFLSWLVCSLSVETSSINQHTFTYQ